MGVSAFLLFFSAASFAGNGALRGIVRGPDGAGVRGAILVMVNAQSEVAGQTRTSTSGAYEIKAIPAGRYRLTVEAAGFRRRIFQNVPVTSAKHAGFDVNLQRASAGVVDPEQIYRFSALSQLLIEVELYHDILKQPPSPKKSASEPLKPPSP